MDVYRSETIALPIMCALLIFATIVLQEERPSTRGSPSRSVSEEFRTRRRIFDPIPEGTCLLLVFADPLTFASGRPVFEATEAETGRNNFPINRRRTQKCSLTVNGCDVAVDRLLRPSTMYIYICRPAKYRKTPKLQDTKNKVPRVLEVAKKPFQTHERSVLFLKECFKNKFSLDVCLLKSFDR